MHSKLCAGCETIFTIQWPSPTNRKYCDLACRRKAEKKRRQESSLLGFCTQCGKLKGAKCCDTCRTRRNKHARQHHILLRAELLVAYGGKCECCKESREEFLALDHIYGGGTKQKNDNGMRGWQFYRWLKHQGFPKDKYRLLCHNCNSARGHYGYCPHEVERHPAMPLLTLIADLAGLNDPIMRHPSRADLVRLRNLGDSAAVSL